MLTVEQKQTLERELQRRQRVRAGAEKRPGGDLLGEPGGVLPEEQQGVQPQLRDPVHTVNGLHDQVHMESEQSVMIENHQNPLSEGRSDSEEGGTVRQKLPSKKKKQLKEKWVFHE